MILLVVLAYAVGLRAWDLGTQPMWVDEAESSINAFSILRHGVPLGEHLGLPVYENTLTIPWPGNAEYEFRDSSYSNKGLAIYHGWLPLYAIAGAFKAGGVPPDVNLAARTPQHSAAEMRRRTILARVPSVTFGAAFLVAAFVAGRAMGGASAGWSALAMAAFARPAVEFAREARYYSATLALTTCCCLALWLVARHGRWRDFLFAAAVLALLFHTHVMSFAIACAAGATAAPWVLRHPRAAVKIVVAGAIIAAAVLPWVLLTGFLGASTDIPKARVLFRSIGDVLAYPMRVWPATLLALATLAWLGAAWAGRGRLPDRLTRPFLERRGALLFLAGWALIGFLCFTLLMPAASYFARRMTLAIMGPALLFRAILFAAAARALVPPRAGRWTPALLGAAVPVAVMLLAARASAWWSPRPAEREDAYQVVEALRGQRFAPDARLYATPNDHLVLTFYTGMPVQSVAPIRRSFLDAYEGEVIVFEAGRYETLPTRQIQSIGAERGRELTEDEAVAAGRQISWEMMRLDLADIPRVHPPTNLPPVDLPAGLLEELVAIQRRETAKAVATGIGRTGSPMFHGFPMPDRGAWWPVFFYRFVDPASRAYGRLNYSERVRGGEAHVLPMHYVMYRSPPRRSATADAAAAGGR